VAVERAAAVPLPEERQPGARLAPAQQQTGAAAAAEGPFLAADRLPVGVQAPRPVRLLAACLEAKATAMPDRQNLLGGETSVSMDAGCSSGVAISFLPLGQLRRAFGRPVSCSA